MVVTDVTSFILAKNPQRITANTIIIKDCLFILFIYIYYCKYLNKFTKKYVSLCYMTFPPKFIWNKKKWTRFKKNGKKQFSSIIVIAVVFIFSIISGSNIIYSLQNFISPEFLKINLCKPPFSDPPSFPYNLCPKGAVHINDLTNPCFAPLTWFVQTIGFSWSRWRKMILSTKDDNLGESELPYAAPIKKVMSGTGIFQLLLLLILPLGVLLIMTIGPIISIIITYCSSFSAYRGMLLTFIFTFLFPILLALIAPILGILQPLEVLYMTVFKPFLSGGALLNMFYNIMYFAVPWVVGIPLILLAVYEVAIVPGIILGGGSLAMGFKNLL